MGKLKALGLAFVAMLAFSAVAASAASADDLTSESYPVTLTGGKDAPFVDQFLTTAGTIQCTTTKYTAKGVAAPTTSVTVEATYAGCTAAGVPKVVNANGCVYKFNIGAATTGDVDFVCPAGQELTVISTPASGTSPCTVHVKPQSDITGTVTYSNIGAGTTREITADLALTGIDYSHTAGSGLAKCSAGSATNGTLNAKAIITGENAAGTAHIGVFMS